MEDGLWGGFVELLWRKGGLLLFKVDALCQQLRGISREVFLYLAYALLMYVHQAIVSASFYVD